jgi:hypothetical protein
MFIDKYGLTNSKPYEQGAENGFLWTLQTVLLEGSQKARIASLRRSINMSRVGQGLYAQNPSHVIDGAISTFHKRDAYMSPDQLIVIMMASYCYGSGIHKEILGEIKNQGYLQYNNIKDDEKRYIHPRDLVLYYALNYPKLANILLLLLVAACVVSCLKAKDHTSGKLLAWTKCMMLKDQFLVMKLGYYLCTLAIKKNHKDWAEVFEIYFPHETHPNRKLAQRVYRGN